ncbi:MAG: S-methyl-5-thioribose-1-phosphate isomerase [Deltaproteobacteria bacterium]|nr:S-methyl-5-thioribose-1-phosphate isomerase [Deltaproteobacteria bacterium]MBM4298084.1 S-methyl-5-thioribose-1-phosphate isomerase [Deltaproteobacteria bacterium]
MAVKTIEWKNDRVIMIDQRLLPQREVYRVCRNYLEVADAIRSMVIRGAPAIGVAAAMGTALGAMAAKEKNFDCDFENIVTALAQTRPTAVNLFWALERMRKVYNENRRRGVAFVKKALKAEAQKVYKEDIEANKRLGQYGAQLLGNAKQLMTHCNAGALATAGYGTALGVMRAFKERGKEFEVWVNETRPFLQGARLTAWELQKEKIPATLVTDNMAGYLMQQGKVDAVVVGCDRVAANGDVANKIGTYTVAVLAKRHGIPFYVAGPTSSIDIDCPTGKDIPIEQRDPKEVSHIFGKELAPKGMKIFNPAFDVTAQELISAIITEKGVIQPPYRQNIRSHVSH